jgi:hypothetical protein
MLATRVNAAGYSTVAWARATEITLSSKGWRKTSRQERGYSGNSSKNKIPWCAKLISPGVDFDPPPTNATRLAVWCGARNGRLITKPAEFSSEYNVPATLWIFVMSKLSARVKSGIMVGKHRASMVFPLPGGPISNKLWPPAAEISNARFATY